MILKNIIESTKLDPEFCADLLGVASDQFQDWLAGARPLPRFVIPEITSILGVTEKTLLQVSSGAGKSDATLAPAIWYKLRDSKLVQADREMVALVRKLGYYMDQLAAIRSENVRRFEPLFRGIRDKVDRTAPPALQGKIAAREFRSMTDLEHGQTAIGEWIRPTLRKLGVLTLESPLKSAVEGCAFLVGSVSGSTPCVFANTYKATWFRRNAVLMHEVGHAIFDLETEQVSIDYTVDNGDELGKQRADELSNQRAQAFAQECLLPKSVLVQLANRFGLKWDSLTASDLATLVAYSHVEERMVLKAAYESELLDADQLQTYSALDCASDLRKLTVHALSTREYLRQQATEMPKWVAEYRNTDLGRRSLRLPSLYVKQVIEALNDRQISTGKAAEMLMMEQDTFLTRFGSLIGNQEKAA